MKRHMTTAVLSLSLGLAACEPPIKSPTIAPVANPCKLSDVRSWPLYKPEFAQFTLHRVAVGDPCGQVVGGVLVAKLGDLPGGGKYIERHNEPAPWTMVQSTFFYNQNGNLDGIYVLNNNPGPGCGIASYGKVPQPWRGDEGNEWRCAVR